MNDSKVTKENLQEFATRFHEKNKSLYFKEADVPEVIPPIVSAWLTENVDPDGAAGVVDKTLSIEGTAADAKAAGDEISGLKNSCIHYFMDTPNTFCGDRIDVDASEYSVETGKKILKNGTIETDSDFNILTLSLDSKYIYRIKSRAGTGYSTNRYMQIQDGNSFVFAFIMAPDNDYVTKFICNIGGVLKVCYRNAYTFDIKKYESCLSAEQKAREYYDQNILDIINDDVKPKLEVTSLLATKASDDILPLFGTYEDKEDDGIEYTVSGTTINAVGTSTDISMYDFYNGEIPNYIAKGKTYSFLYKAEKLSESATLLTARVKVLINGEGTWTSLPNNTPTDIEIPSNATSIIIRVWASASGIVANQDFTIIVSTKDDFEERLEEVESSIDSMELALDDNSILEYTNDTFTTGVDNSGMRLTVMSYNVAHYNHDSESYINNEKLFNLKKLISAVMPDFIGVQENGYIDGIDKSPNEYIYAPVLSYHAGIAGPTIYSKIDINQVIGFLSFSTGRHLQAQRYTVNNKNLLFISAHPVSNYNSTGSTSAESIAQRLIEYTELFKWIYQEITLLKDGSPVTCPSWDYCIITGDFNSITSTDHTNLKTLASARGFTLANGGWLGWLETCRNSAGNERISIDNIIVSPNIVIDSVTSHKGWYEKLYSDHYPLSAVLTLK